MRRRVILVLLNVVLLCALAAPAAARGGVGNPRNDPEHQPPHGQT